MWSVVGIGSEYSKSDVFLSSVLTDASDFFLRVWLVEPSVWRSGSHLPDRFDRPRPVDACHATPMAVGTATHKPDHHVLNRGG